MTNIVLLWKAGSPHGPIGLLADEARSGEDPTRPEQMLKAASDQKTGRRALSRVTNALRRIVHPEHVQLRRENAALWAQAKNVGSELLDARARLEANQLQHSEQINRLEKQNEA